MKKYSMKHKKKATRRMKIKKPKGGAELPAASSMSLPPPLAASSMSLPLPLAASSLPLADSSSSVSSLDASSATSEPDNSKQSYFQKINIPGANWWKNFKMPWSGGKKHKKKPN